MNQKLLLIDTYGLIFRAYLAYPSFLKTSDGRDTNAIFGFLQMLINCIEKFEPEYMACAIESSTPTFRHLIYPEYKQNRKEKPQELKEQINAIISLIDKLNISIFQKDGYEADDVIGSIAKLNEAKLSKIEIITGDRDLLQLISEKIYVFMPGKNFSQLVEYNPQTFKSKFNIEVEKYIFYKSLTGDASDNIKGIPGIGPKTAVELVNRFNSINELKSNLDLINPRIAESIIEHQHLLEKYYELSKIKCDLDITIKLNDIRTKNININALRKIINEYEFFSLSKKIAKFIDNFQQKYHPFSLFANDWSNYEIEYTLADDIKSTNISKTIYVLKTYNGFLLGDGQNFVEVNDDQNLYKIWIITKPTEIIGFGLKDFIKKLINFDLKQIYSLNWIDLKLAWYLIRNDLEFLDINDLTKHLKCKSIKQIYQKTLLKINELQLEKVWNLEKKIQIILAYMEVNGIPCSQKYLTKKEKQYKKILEKTKEKMYNIIGHEFNPNSTKELSHILFNVLKLPVIKKTKTGFSTDDDTLTSLEDKHEIISYLKKYRSYSKTLNTYIIGLKKHLTQDGKIHTTFLQDTVSTGRLSSINPNLQNLPTIEPFASDVRKAFQLESGHFLSFDYSQIDLRVLAHESKDTNLIQAFIDKKDIHTITAQLILNKKEITPDERKFAKTINFGIIYGMESYGLSQALNISIEEASKFIDDYFKKFPGVKNYFEIIEDNLNKKGFVSTLLGRRRYFPGWQTQIKFIKKSIFREAINMPIQGGSSDIIKLSMLKIHEYIQNKKLNVKIVLQIHDELIFLAEEQNLNDIMEEIKYIMENIIELIVPLEVNCKIGIDLTFKN